MNIQRVIRRKVKALGSQRALAKELGISQSYLNDVLKGRKEPGEGILAPMGLERVVTYRPRRATP